MKPFDRGTREVLGVLVSITQYIAGDGSPHEYHVDLRRDIRLTPPGGLRHHPSNAELAALVTGRGLSSSDFSDQAASLGAAIRHAIRVLREQESTDTRVPDWIPALRKQLEAELS